MPGERFEIDSQAALWIERMNHPVHDTAVAAAFDRWIFADPRHVESYARLAALWQSSTLERALGTYAPRNDNEAHDAPSGELPAMHDSETRRGLRSWLRPRRLGGIAAALAALVLGVPLAQGLAAPDNIYISAQGHDRTVMLADGSSIRMNGGSKLSVRLTPWSRKVTMQRGEAFFDIAHERWRGFSVDTGSTRISVLGTAFDVNVLTSGEREIRVYRGLVSVLAGNGEWHLPAGTGLAISGARVRSLEDVEGGAPGWLDGWLDAQDANLSGLIERLNRSADRPTVLADPALGELRITGRFRTDQPREMLDTLAAIHDLQWKMEDGRYILRRK